MALVHPQPLYRPLLLGLAVFAAFFVNLGNIPLFDLDEGAFSEATREMLARGDLVSPWLNGEPRFDKPVLIHWLQAASVTLFGLNEFALRLPSALAATAWVLLTFAFLRRVADERTGFLGAIMLAFSVQIGIIGKAATADAVLNLFLAASLFAVFLHWRERRQRWIYAAFAAIGLGFLTKGPVAVVIPLAVSFLFYASQGEWRAWLRAVFHPGGIALFLAINLPWYTAQYLAQGQDFIDGFFLKHNVDRFGDSMEGHGGGWLYYLVVAPLAVLPFSAVLFKAVARVPAAWRSDLGRFALIWFGFVLVLFTFSGTKLPHYLNYGLTGALVLMALAVQQMHSRLALLLPGLLMFTVLAALPSIVGAVLPTIDEPEVVALLSGYGQYFPTAYLLTMLALAAFTVALMAWKRPRLDAHLYAVGLAGTLAVGLWLVPTIAQIQQEPIRAAGLTARDLPGETTLVMWKMRTPSASVYARRVFLERRPEPGEVVLTHRHRLADLDVPTEVLYARRGVVLARLADTDD